ncbi:hypothetical protein N8I74_14370 [Chitiniphilus purpureus]|uniref:NolW-like domain-containing protein n=1 Tax=Chitiniphilus purpureus TaxID=2981137 RepID=A0ABY6DJS9_9NEIS|nr:hypothetical protein [Chitiniphilus sp. CD1]UXY14493.1 hypothetical protein N8I74_14370 [Chitiniphilus sp. CD1]
MRPWLVWLLMLVAGGALAERMDVVTLRHRPAAELLPVLRDSVPDAAIQAHHNQLIVRSPDTATYEQVLALLDRLDIAARNLSVTVEQREGHSRAGRALGLEGVAISNRGVGVGLRLFGGGTRDEGVSTQRVRVLDGGHAFIRLGSERFQPQVAVATRSGHGVVLGGGQWIATGSGFWAEPRLLGDHSVLLRLYPEQSRFGPEGSIEQHSAYSEVRGTLGEWLPVGQSSIAGASRSRGSHTGDSTAHSTYTVWVKIDSAP